MCQDSEYGNSTKPEENLFETVRTNIILFETDFIEN